MTCRCLLLLLLLGACAAPPAPLSLGSIELGVPLAEQDELHACGLAALSTLCAYHGIELPVSRRQDLARRATENEGLTAGELRDELRALGFEAYLFSGTLDDGPTGLAHHLAAGRPLLVLLSGETTAHYALVTGRDAQDGRVVLQDPRRGRVVLDAPDFSRQWQAAQRLTLLAVRAP